MKQQDGDAVLGPEMWRKATQEVLALAEQHPSTDAVFHIKWWLPLRGQMMLLVGPPGVGKSTIAKWLARRVNERLGCEVLKVFVINATTKLPPDISGVIMRGEDGPYFAPIGIMRDVFQAAEDGYLVIVLIDEITALSQSMINAWQAVLTERQAGDLILRPNIRFLGACNHPDEMVAPAALPSPFVDRMAQFQITDMAKVRDSWLEWVRDYIDHRDWESEEDAWLIGQHMGPWLEAIRRYIEQQADRLVFKPPKQSVPRHGVGPDAKGASPRSWVSLAVAMSWYPATKGSVATGQEIARATCGSVGNQFMDWFAKERSFLASTLMSIPEADFATVVGMADTQEVVMAVEDLFKKRVLTRGEFVRCCKAMHHAGMSMDQRKQAISATQVNLAILAARSGLDPVADTEIADAIKMAKGAKL